MRLDSFNPIEAEMSDLGLDISSSSESATLLPFTAPSLNLTSKLSLAQQKGQAAVDLYRIWWENYDKMTRGDGGGEGWGRVKKDGDKMSSTFVLCLVAFLFSLSFLIMMVVVICKKWKRRRAAKVSTSRLSLPPPYEMVMEEKERLATATGLPSYQEACPDTSYQEACPDTS